MEAAAPRESWCGGFLVGLSQQGWDARLKTQ